MRPNEHDPARCNICMDDSVWEHNTLGKTAQEMFGDDAPNSWATTPDTMQWFEDHERAGYAFKLTDYLDPDGHKGQYMEEVKRPGE